MVVITMEMVASIMEMVVITMEMVVITMEMVVIIMEMVVIIMEMEASIMEEMVAGTMVSVTVDVQIPTMEVVADPTQIMEMAGTMAIIMVVQILDNKSKNINICTVKTEDSESTK